MEAHFAVLSLGSNTGNRASILDAARTALAEQVGPLVKTSREYITEPWGLFDPAGGVPQPFLNQVVIAETWLSPVAILDRIRQIELELGRPGHDPEYTADGERLYRDRTVDIDILFFDSEIINTERLVIPHPRLAERRFVLEPLAEIIPGFIHPVLKISLKELFNSFLLDDSQ